MINLRSLPAILAIAFVANLANATTTTAVVAKKSPCNDATTEPVIQIPLPGHAFGVLPSQDGCRVFVSITQPDSQKPAGIEVFKRSAGRITHSTLAIIEDGHPLDMVLTHDGKTLIVADQDDVVFFDAKALENSNPDAVTSQALLGRLKYTDNAGSIYVNVTVDDRFLFVADERARTITVVDLKKAMKNKFNADSVVGQLPTGNSPVSLVFSPDQSKLYATTEIGPRVSGWPAKCGAQNDSEGAIIVLDVKKAEVDPAHAVLATVPAGCSPVRLALSPDGDTAYVSGRGEGALLVFDTGKLLTAPENSEVGRVPLGAPIGLAVINGGAQVVVANLRSLDPSEALKNQELSIIDTSKISDGEDAKIGSVKTGAYPRELRVSADGNTLFLTNFNSNSLQIFDLKRFGDN